MLVAIQQVGRMLTLFSFVLNAFAVLIRFIVYIITPNNKYDIKINQKNTKTWTEEMDERLNFFLCFHFLFGKGMCESSLQTHNINVMVKKA